MKQVTAEILSNKRVLKCPGAAYSLLRVRAPEIASGSKPGQFVMLGCGSDTLLRRPLSLHGAASSGEIEFLYATPHGKGMQWLSEAEEGAALNLIGPLGNGFRLDSKARNLLLVAGGIGVAPLKFLAETAIASGHNVTMLVGARTKEGVYSGSLLPDGANINFCTDDGSLGRKTPVTYLIPEYLKWADIIYACGPQAMYESISRQMKGWPEEKPVQISLEVRMGCGTGVCYSCTIRTRRGLCRVCKEGPVFNIKDIIWQEVRI